MTNVQAKLINSIKKGPSKKSKIIFFSKGNITVENKNYRKGEVVFVKKDDEDKFKEGGEIYIYDDLMSSFTKSNGINKSLLLNKFTNIFNLSKEKELQCNGKEKIILKEKERENFLVRKNLEEKFNCISFIGSVNDKMVIGLGNQSVFETDITLHHTYGIPYIPGQAIKGVFRNYIIQEYFSSDEKNAIQNKNFELIFGGKNCAGKVVFQDVFPRNNFNIALDVMTPHYKLYYDKENSLPLDSDSPTPIYFLVIKDTEFEFNVAIDKSISNEKWNSTDASGLDEFITENLIETLTFQGIGAKTSVGYGYFDIKKTIITALRKKKELIEKEKKIREGKNKFREETKGMSELQVDFYKLNQFKNGSEKNQKIMDFFSQKIELLELNEQKELAEFIKEYLIEIKKWKYKDGKNGKESKIAKKIKKICEVLGEALPK